MLQQCDAELPVLLPPGRGLGQEEIDKVGAIPRAAIRIGVLDSVDAAKPVLGQDGRFVADALGVVGGSLHPALRLHCFPLYQRQQQLQVHRLRAVMVEARRAGALLVVGLPPAGEGDQ